MIDRTQNCSKHSPQAHSIQYLKDKETIIITIVAQNFDEMSFLQAKNFRVICKIYKVCRNLVHLINEHIELQCIVPIAFVAISTYTITTSGLHQCITGK